MRTGETYTYKSYDRGLNENTTGKIKYFVPKKIDFSTISYETIYYIEKTLTIGQERFLDF